MAYSKQTWDTSSHVDPTRMNHIEDGIADNSFESGSNDNGRWIKFTDGTMICYKSIPFRNLAVNTAWGVLYESALLDLGDFPQTFYSAPYVSGSVVNGNAWLEAVPRTSPSNIGQTRVVRPTTATIDFDIHIIAIGRWKA